MSWEDDIRAMAHPIFILYKFCCLIIVFIITLLIILITVKTIKESPSCSVKNFYVPALNRLDNANTSSSNNFIFFDLQLKNGLDEISVRYDPINLAFFYGPNTSLSIGNYTLGGFHQGKKKGAQRRDVVETHGVPWDDAVKAVSNGSTVIFRLDLTAKIRFKEWFFMSKKRNLAVWANMEINNSGKKVQKEAIELTSGSSRIGGYLNTMWLSVFVNLFVTCLLLKQCF
ncbi:NDR1-like [Olea europaea subsp. europaea]|uniref:NDR1-like n=1 Tax=Olea europaea subsp. europaea TaxID=158383 RepID=A0A8S0TAL1_OLEEU|nr:NDR1-like [Olea europaea subsp. europaea]